MLYMSLNCLCTEPCAKALLLSHFTGGGTDLAKLSSQGPRAGTEGPDSNPNIQSLILKLKKRYF